MNKWLNRAIIVFQYIYETRIAPFLATYCYAAWLPLYNWAKKKNICFVVNIADGTGQVLPELDNFFMALQLGEIDSSKKYVWLRTGNDFSKTLVPLYGKQFHYARVSNLLYDLCLPMLMKWHDITYDAGMSGLHWQLPQAGPWTYPKPWQTFLYMDKKPDILSRWRTWYRRRLDGSEYAPLREAYFAPSQELQAFLGSKTANIVLVHIKTNIMNATARFTDPDTYIPAIDYLQAKGYRIVFVGREKMPKEFYGRNILNYSESRVASFLHDLQLFSLAEFSITGGSGIAWIADCLRKPVLYLNSWHVFMPPAGKECVFVPSLVKNNKNGQLLSFQQQYALYLHTSAAQGDKFPFDLYEPVNASAEDVLQGLYELEALIESTQPLSAEQEKFRMLEKESWMAYAGSRISNSFLQHHQDLLQ